MLSAIVVIAAFVGQSHEVIGDRSRGSQPSAANWAGDPQLTRYPVVHLPLRVSLDGDPSSATITRATSTCRPSARYRRST